MKSGKVVRSVAQIIDKQVAFRRELQKARKAMALKRRNEREVYVLFGKLMVQYPANSEVLKSFLDFLQSLSSEELIEQVSLKDIARIYKRISETNKFDVELNLDLFYFIHNVLDNEAESLRLYKDYKQRILTSFKKFEERVGGG